MYPKHYCSGRCTIIQILSVIFVIIGVSAQDNQHERFNVSSIISHSDYRAKMSEEELIIFIHDYFDSVNEKTSVSSTNEISLVDPDQEWNATRLFNKAQEKTDETLRKNEEPSEVRSSTSPPLTSVSTDPQTRDEGDPFLVWSDFGCEDKTHGGYYADIVTHCKYFYICVFQPLFNIKLNRTVTKISRYIMQCPKATAYSQIRRVCDFEENVRDECPNSREHFK